MCPTFTRSERLSGKNSFDRVFREGRRFHCRSLMVVACPNVQAVSRLGLSVGRAHGAAVRRNRMKRVIREAFRLNKESLGVPCDLVVVPRRDWKDVRLADIQEDFQRILREITQTFSA